ncbi:MAG: hypothetical protein GW911_14185 [Armatimonadetes bacterium]|nr:hypothetical protein [Armatimonadota bacterium]NCP31949.1 hypothetical protein [Armatimonadota bacterium]NCQ27470.1 hypothetical protein [Armatimonadota bacterium]NDK13174.1 hypothetical protein [Armatimonadota bacterium]
MAALGGDSFQVRVLPTAARIAAGLRGRGKQFLREGADPLEELAQERDADDHERESQLA